MAAETAHVKRYLARALHGIDMEENAGLGGDLADFFHGLQDAGFVVGQHHADEPGLGPNGALNVRRIDEAAGLGRNISRFHSEDRPAAGLPAEPQNAQSTW